MKLYIDIDDTLVTWLAEDMDTPHPYGYGAEGWRANEDVRAFAYAWDGDLVIWSGGGRDYAETWARRLLPDLKWTAFAKFNAIPGPDDVFIDDMPFEAWAHRSVHPMCLSPVGQ